MKIRRRGRRLSEQLHIDLPVDRFMNKTRPVFMLGSCFAMELRDYMRRHGYSLFEVDDYKQKRHRTVLTWYNTYSILYEFLLADGRFDRGKEDWWELPDGRWQCGIRRLRFAKSREELATSIKTVDDRIIQGLTQANVVVITLGMTECWRQPTGQRHVICTAPGYGSNLTGKGGGFGTEFELVSYQSNLNNLVRCVEILQKINPKARIVLTVSPVPLRFTFRSGIDHCVANCESKSILRAMVGEIISAYSHVIYFPAYEMVTHMDRHKAYFEDGRHVQKTVVNSIMQRFEESYCEE